MDRFDINMNSISSARDVNEYYECIEKKEKEEKYYNEMPIRQNEEIIMRLEKLVLDVNKTKKSEKIMIFLMIITLIFTVISVLFSIIK